VTTFAWVTFSGAKSTWRLAPSVSCNLPKHGTQPKVANKKNRANTSHVQDKREKLSTDSIHPMIENVEQINS
jgi:hypothetical protein